MKVNIYITLIICSCILSHGEGHDGLLELDKDNFLETLTEVGHDYDYVLLEFYAHWCPACKAFQPTYIEIAKHLHLLMVEEEIEWDTDDALIPRGPRPLRVAVARIDCPDNAQLCDEFSIKSYPTMMLDSALNFASKSLENIKMVNPKPRNFHGVLQALQELLDRDFENPLRSKNLLKVKNVGKENSEQDSKPENSVVLKSPTTKHPDVSNHGEGKVSVSEEDLIGATMLSFEYVLSNTLLKGNAAREALFNWLDLLSKTHSVDACASGSATALEVLSKSWPIHSDAIIDIENLRKVQICGNLSDIPPWVECAGSSSQYRGYTCGLWQLLHTTSVRLVDGTRAKSGAKWMETVKSFIQFYFQCQDCANHFLQFARSQDAMDVSSKDDAVLWLWRTHNKVNERLYQEQDVAGLGDPAFPHKQWPPPEICPGCQVNGQWKENSVAQFLFNYYKGMHVSDSNSETDHRFNKSETHSSKVEASWLRAFLLFALVFGLVHSALQKNYLYNFGGCRRSINRFKR